MKRSLPALHLRRSPLVYVLAQVRISAVMAMDKYVPQIQEQFRLNGFPRFRRGQVKEIRLDAEAPKITSSERYEFQNKDATAGIVLAPDFVTLHTTKYSTYEDFESAFRLALEVIHGVVNLSLAERLGLRYIDLIRLGPGEEFSAYLNPRLLGFDASQIGAKGALNRLEFLAITEVGRIVARCSQQGGAFLPPDLTPTSLAHTVELNENELVTILDIDHFSESATEFNIPSVLEMMGSLHDTIDKTFRSSVTRYALERWGKGE